MTTCSKYLSQQLAKQIDIDLMSPSGGFSIDQLMELAGLSVAEAIHKVYSPDKSKNLLICAGPGNNGGDGLVCARHLSHFGYSPSIFYPKQTDKPLYKNLILQCRNLNIPFIEPEQFDNELIKTDVVVDAIFGFSFSGDIRPPFDTIINRINESRKPVVAVDIPSGWDVEQGNISLKGLRNISVLVSLTAPKRCAEGFSGIHFVGGRFVPNDLIKKYNLNLPKYAGHDQSVLVSGHKL